MSSPSRSLMRSRWKSQAQRDEKPRTYIYLYTPRDIMTAGGRFFRFLRSRFVARAYVNIYTYTLHYNIYTRVYTHASCLTRASIVLCHFASFAYLAGSRMIFRAPGVCSFLFIAARGTDSVVILEIEKARLHVFHMLFRWRLYKCSSCLSFLRESFRIGVYLVCATCGRVCVCVFLICILYDVKLDMMDWWYIFMVISGKAERYGVKYK